MTVRVKLFLLGPFRAERAGDRLTAFKSNKVRALLAYLAVEADRPHHRDVLAGMLWPDSPNALALLRDVLSALRRVVGDREAAVPIVQTRGDTLRLDPATVWLDVAAFEDLAARTAGVVARTADVEAWEQAAALYRGDFLEGFSLAGSPDFETWALLKREALRQAMQETLYRLTTCHLQRGDYPAAQAGARRQLALDDYSEEAHRQLLRALALAGQRNQALAHYAEYGALLDEELGVEPDIRTTALYQRIRAGSLRPTLVSATPRPSPLTERRPGLVGRAAELERLERALHGVQRGTGRVMVVTGTAGSGKTTLVQGFAKRSLTRFEKLLVARGTCNAHVGSGDPYLPFREILRLLSGDFDVPATTGVLPLAYEQRVEACLPTVTRALSEQGADLVGKLIPTPSSTPETSAPEAKPLSPAALCDQVTCVFRAIARQCPLVLILDDLQWADGGTLNLLAHLGHRLDGSRILLIGLYRSTEIGAGHALLPIVRELQRRHGDIVVDLDRVAGEDFVTAFLDSVPNRFPPGFHAQLARQTGGHALFTAALVQQMQDDGTLARDADGRWRIDAALDWSKLPPRVEAVIARRFDRLPERCRDLLALASVEGEVFTAEVLARASGRPLEDVERTLRGLGKGQSGDPRHDLVYALGLERVADRRVARYRFRHALFQHYLTTRLDAVQRARYHEAIGHALADVHAGHRDAVAAQLAYHFEAAGLIEEAVAYWLRAGQQAYRLSAPTESVALYRRGLELLERLPPGAPRDRRELELLLSQESTLMITRGWGAPERASSLQRAYQLGQRLGETTRLLPVLQELASIHIARAEHRTALDYAERLLALAESSGDDLGRVLGSRMAGTANFFLGHYAQARAHLETGLRNYAALSPETRRAKHILTAEEGHRQRVWPPHVWLVLGYPAQAVALSREALAHAQTMEYVGVLAATLTIDGAAFHAIARYPQAALGYAEQLLALVEKHPLPSYRGWATFYHGWARTQHGETGEGLVEMQSGLQQLNATGTVGSTLHLLTLLAEVYVQCGAWERGATTLSQALHRTARTGERSYLAETHRVQGVLHRRREAPEAAEASFARAIEIAQRQSARLWELRATLDLARLWAGQGRVAEARARLAQIYRQFTEGFDTPDLAAARAVLDELDPQAASRVD